MILRFKDLRLTQCRRVEKYKLWKIYLENIMFDKSKF